MPLTFSELKEHAPPAAAVTLLVLGFGIKLTLSGLHFWLPQTYAAAPAVAVAVLSGPMLTAGLLGWRRFLIAQAPGLSGWSDVFVWVGAIGVGLNIAAGLVQRNPRVVLGYSSVSPTAG